MAKEIDMHKPKSTDDKKKSFKDQVKGTDAFAQAIKKHLKEYAQKDSLFKKKLLNKEKNFKDCITYIFNQVKASGCIGYEDEEIFKLARHYYDEDKIKVGDPVTGGEVIVNQQFTPSDEEIEKAKKKALDKVFEDERTRLTNKKKPIKTPEKKKECNEPKTLF